MVPDCVDFSLDRNFRNDNITVMKLSATAQEMGAAWGVNRSMAQIHALLFFHGQPLHADDICQTLSVARSNVSNSLKELLNWKLISTTQMLGDRRTYYQSKEDVWALFHTIVEERKRREFDPTVRMLRELVEAPGFGDEPFVSQQRVRDTLQLMNTLESWADEMLRMSPGTMEKLLHLGVRVQKLVRGRKARRNE